jgi:hypothetical protein
MPLASGSYAVEHVAGNKPVRKFLTGYWPNPVISDFQKLARANLQFYWKVRDGKLVERQKLGKLVPDRIVVRDELGEEICHWSVDEERIATRCSGSKTP